MRYTKDDILEGVNTWVFNQKSLFFGNINQCPFERNDGERSYFLCEGWSKKKCYAVLGREAIRIYHSKKEVVRFESILNKNWRDRCPCGIENKLGDDFSVVRLAEELLDKNKDFFNEEEG